MRGVVRSLFQVLVLALAGPVFSQLSYSLTSAGSLSPGKPTNATGINALGQVVGWGYMDEMAGFDQVYHPFLFANGTLTDLGTAGWDMAAANGINDQGQIVGVLVSATGFSQDAFSYAGGIMTDIGVSGSVTCATAVNTEGQIVGYSEDPMTGIQNPFLYSDGVYSDLGTIAGIGDGQALAVNDSATVVGWCAATPYYHAFSWSNGQFTDLGTFGIQPGAESVARAISNSGLIAGQSNMTSGGPHVFIYSNGQMQDLGLFSGAYWADAFGVNDAGQVVGWASCSDRMHAFFYSGLTMVDLNTLLDSSGAGWFVDQAIAINDAGQIAANALGPDGVGHAVLLTPNAGCGGNLSLDSYSGDSTKVPLSVEVRKAGTLQVLQRQIVYVKANGTFSFPSALKGTFDVAVKGSHWLRKTLHGVVFPGHGYVSGLSASLVNGDVNGDNTINLADLTAVSAAWRSTPGSANWNPNADLNGDGAVNLADWMIVAQNWRMSGDQ